MDEVKRTLYVFSFCACTTVRKFKYCIADQPLIKRSAGPCQDNELPVLKIFVNYAVSTSSTFSSSSPSQM
jgi:hypothetical protein